MLEFSLGSDAADLADTPCVVVGIFEGALSPAATNECLQPSVECS